MQNTLYTKTLITTLLTDDDMPNDYIKCPEKYFISIGDTNAREYMASHLQDNGVGFVPGVVLLRNLDGPIFGFKHETADVVSTWIELLALVRSHYEGSERLTFIFDSPYELKLKEVKDTFNLEVTDCSHRKAIVKRYTVSKNSLLPGLLEGATAVYQFFHEVLGENGPLTELKDHITFLRGVYAMKKI